MKYTELRPKTQRVDLSGNEIKIPSLFDKARAVLTSYRQIHIKDPDEYWMSPGTYQQLRHLALPTNFGMDFSFDTLFGTKVNVTKTLEDGDIQAVKINRLSKGSSEVFMWPADDQLAAFEYALRNSS